MKQFKAHGHTWDVSVTLAAMERVRDLAEVNIGDLIQGNPPLGVRLTTDELLFGNVLWAVLQPQAASRNVAREQFLELDGDNFADSFDALMGELIDFFQKRGRAEQATALTAQLKALKAAADLAAKRVASLDIDKLIESTFSSSATSVPGSSASTPQT
jgi:hypothetical protein